jgi:hypothetical protein
MDELWQVETQFWMEQGYPPDVAPWLTIVRWMYNGDLRPLISRMHLVWGIS